MITPGNFQRGRFTYTAADGTAREVPVDFNPATLEYSISLNTRGEGGQTQQAAGAASARLTLDLIFDTTDTGDDVRRKTNPVERLLQPQPPAGGAGGPPHAPPLVTFEWGAFTFQGVVDSFRQTMDFFSASGVPLRAAVSLALSQPNYQFDQEGRAAVDQAFVLPGGSPSALAAAIGDPSAARGIALANGLESLRAEAGAAIAVGGGVSIGAAAGFSAGAGVGLGLGGGFSAGGSAGAGAGVGVSAGIGFGASAGAGAGGGAFAGLRAGSAPAAASTLAPERLLARASAPAIGTGAAFDVTGRAVAQQSGAFQANVGAAGALRFDES